MGKHNRRGLSAPIMFAGALTGVMVLATTQPQIVAVEPAALVVGGSSTNPSGTGIEDFFGGIFNPPGTEIERVNFFLGPLGLARAIRSTGDPDDVLLTSGWGAANASLLMTVEKTLNPDNPDLTGTTWILNDNVSRPNGGYGTRYPIFALVGVNPLPTPGDVDAPVLDVGYLYNVNSNAPAYPGNLVSVANSFAAYFDDRLDQADLTLPPEALADMNGEDGDPGQHYHFIVDANGDVVGEPEPVDGNVTYVTYVKDGLPLVAPLRELPGGDILADGLEPLLTVAVNAGYPDNDPLSDPSQYRPAGFVPPPAQLVAAARQVPGALEGGLDNVREDLSGASGLIGDAPNRTPLTNLWRPSSKSSPEPTADEPSSRSRPVRDAIQGTVDNFTERLKSAVRGDRSDGPA